LPCLSLAAHCRPSAPFLRAERLCALSTLGRMAASVIDAKRVRVDSRTVFEVPVHLQLIKKVGAGGFGVVAAFADTQNGGKVAVKKITGLMNDLMDCKRILREVRLLKSLRHENILSLSGVYARARSSGYVEDIYIATEFMQMDLHKVINSSAGRKMTEDHRKFLTYQMLKGLLYLHSADVIHRDLTPSNLLVNAKCALKICDFGLARGACADSQVPEECRTPMTEYVVTRWYRAPEVMLTEGSYAKSIDVWSVGCILAEMMKFKPIFPGKDYLDQTRCILSVVGLPPNEELSWLAAPSLRFVQKTLKAPAAVPDWSAQFFPKFSVSERQAVERMLCFSPTLRASVRELLQETYFRDMRDEGDEVEADHPVDWSFDNFCPTLESLRERLVAEFTFFLSQESVESEPPVAPGGLPCYSTQPAPEPSPGGKPISADTAPPELGSMGQHPLGHHRGRGADGTAGWLPGSAARALILDAPSEWFQDAPRAAAPGLQAAFAEPSLRLTVAAERLAVPAREKCRVAAVASLTAATSGVCESSRSLPRPGVDVVCAIDVSSSMQGSKIQQVRASLAFLADELGPEDRLALVAFDDSAEVVMPLSLMNSEGRSLLRQIVESLRTGNGTAISMGLVLATEVLARRQKPSDVSVVMLLSDGQTLDDDGQGWLLLNEPRRCLPLGTRLHTFGYGARHDAELMSRLAQRGEGAYFFVRSDDDFSEQIADCLGSVLGIVFPRLLLRVLPEAGGCAPSVFAMHGALNWARAADGGQTWAEVGPLAADASRDIVIELDLPEGMAGSESAVVVESSSKPAGSDCIGVRLAISRPDFCSEHFDKSVLLHKARVSVALALQNAHREASSGRLKAAQRSLEALWEELNAGANASHPLVQGLLADLRRCSSSYASEQEYLMAGADALASASSHLQQQPTPTSPCYRTPTSAQMVQRAAGYRAEMSSPSERQPESPPP